MRFRPTLSLAVWGVAILVTFASAQIVPLAIPQHVEAGSTFSVSTEGSGKAVLYIVGPGQALRHDVQLGEKIEFAPGELHNAGHYSAFLVGPSSTQTAEFDVIAAQPSTLSFLAKPSRLPVDSHAGISGVVYVFDAFRNLVLVPTDVSFELSQGRGAAQTRTVATNNGVVWVKLDSASQAGTAQFLARVGGVAEKRVIQQVPGEPCNLRMSAHKSGAWVEVETEPLRDCKGNAVPDGTIVTFIERNNGAESTVDVPLKRGVARTNLPANDGATISVATGVVMGNEIRWRP
ncbi:MAG TPA: hypothetical protein VNY51_05495 [Candidatus Dormibacteraeota bacterium]|jgi:hypothetical protein|nr:hypothetical protein [Candidatus Dormibacteraeota bacterium]